MYIAIMKVLTVCLGNICRSPLAEGILKKLSFERGLEWIVDSAGTSDWHEGEPPCQGSIEVARQAGIDISKLRGRQVDKNDFQKFDLILAMDTSNYNNLLKMSPAEEHNNKIEMILNYSFPGENRSVPDSYYTGNYKEVFELLYDSCVKIIEKHS
jgi:protein-tyrosine phosphatase